jgi:hypothetical protein
MKVKTLITSIINRVVKNLGAYKVDRYKRDFIKHNKRCFSKQGDECGSGINEPVILFEFNTFQSPHIAYSYLANVLAGKYGARIVAYEAHVNVSFLRKLEWKFSCIFSLREFAIYRSFGTSEFFLAQFNRSQIRTAQLLTAEVLKDVKTKQDIELICLDGVLLGDLIYDTYLTVYKKKTIEIHDGSFQKYLLAAVTLYVYWREYFETHDVRAVNASHSVYAYAIPLRIAVNRDIPAFVSLPYHIYRLSKNKLIDNNDFFDYKKDFCALPTKVQKEGLEKAKSRMALRFAGEVGVDMRYSTKSAYGAKKVMRLLKESSRTKVLVATHCFYDNPHSYGNNLFPDFYEWLDFLGKMTLKTDYDWYIKTHPDYLPGTMEIINSFVNLYPQLHLLPADSSHHQIIEEGINVALTCYGTIGFEYAALGIPVVNASLSNPHIAFDFNIHPRSLDEYRNTIENLHLIDFNIDKNEVYTYYFMRHIYDARDLLFSDYDKMLDEVGGYSEQFSTKVYGIWIRDWTPEKHSNLINKISQFVDSGVFRC